jgi:hypothetical protein
MLAWASGLVPLLVIVLVIVLVPACRAERQPAEPRAVYMIAAEPHTHSGDGDGERDSDSAPKRPALGVLEGKAAYYSDALRGRATASGAPYDPSALTAAHRSLPFGTVVRVVRPDTGAEVVVRINDRGPFGDEARILDLSRAAAERLDMIRAGVIPIRAEVLEYGGK